MTIPEAILLGDPDPPLQDNKIARALGFFGVACRKLSTAEVLAEGVAHDRAAAKSKLFCSAKAFLHLTEGLKSALNGEQFWKERVHSVFVYPGDDPDALHKSARILTGDSGAVVRKIDPGAGDFVVSNQLDDFCGVMAGLRVAASKAHGAASVLTTSKGNAINIISLDQGATFLKLEYQKVPVFLSTSTHILDIDAEPASRNFDVRDHFLSAVPLVLYIKWAFAETCWSAPETNACLLIDDPVLKSTYGCVNFEEVLALMKRHRFSTNIAFIPWNWRRSAPEVVRLFRENPEQYSISIHGCDHTRAEFGSPDRRWLYLKAKQAIERMNHHESTTGIHHDRVMVFPQGVFSEAAMSVLKHTDLIAAVNNDVISADLSPRAIAISELWDIAVMGYSNFPIFTRRYPWEGVENFAFDILLGKPAIIVIHHDFCSDHCMRLVKFIERLNALKCPLRWRSLGEVIRRSYRQRGLSSSVMEIEMYGTELRVENLSGQPKRYLIRRRESDPSATKEICAGSRKLAWNFSADRLAFGIELDPGQGSTVAIKFHDLSGNGQSREGVSYKVKTMLRRYLCEVRDNYIMTTKSRLAGLAR